MRAWIYCVIFATTTLFWTGCDSGIGVVEDPTRDSSSEERGPIESEPEAEESVAE